MAVRQLPFPVPPRHDPTVLVIHADLRAFHAAEPFAGTLLSPAERARADAYAFENLRTRYRLRHGLLRVLLGRWRSCPPAELVFADGAYGKPSFADGAGPHFNLTDSGDDVAIAISWGHEVGIDVERVRALEDMEGLAAHVFSTAEQREFRDLPAAEKVGAFFKGWTTKEAVVKALGTGLSMPLASFDVSLSMHGPAAILRIEDDDATAWSVAALDLGSALAATVAARVPTLAIGCHSLTPGGILGVPSPQLDIRFDEPVG